MKETQRLDKILAHLGHGSRKEIKEMVKKGLVMVDGLAVKDSGLQVNPYTSKIIVSGADVEYREFVYLMLNKPQGVISATHDRQAQTVVDLLAPELAIFEVFPVGRLDKDTEGLLILTNDGNLAHNLLVPKKHVPKTYYAKVEGKVTEADQAAFSSGVQLDDGYKTIPAELEIVHSGEISEVKLTIFEGKFHQVKRMFEATGKKVTYLKRLAMGDLLLDPGLGLGEYRELTIAELKLLGR